MTLIEILLLIIALLLAMEVGMNILMNILVSARAYMQFDSLVKDMREKLEDL
jgi:hypothetical protein